MFLIVGLGNPTKQYEKTRHNIGFDVMDALADKYNISISENKHKALCGKGVIEGMKVVLAKPQTYMNLSGESVAELVNYYKLDPESELIVVFDDISLEPGNIRIRKKGSAGGHNRNQKYYCHDRHAEFYAHQSRCRREAEGLGSGRLCVGTFQYRRPRQSGGSDRTCDGCHRFDDAGRSRQGNE